MHYINIINCSFSNF